MDDPDKSKEKELEEEEDLDYIPDLASIQLPFDDNTLAKTFETGLDSLESWNEFIEFVSGRDVELKNYKDELHYGDTPKTSDPIVNRGRRASADSQISPFKAKSFEEVDASAEGIKGEILRQRRASYNKISTSQRSFVSLLSSQSNKILKSVGSDLLHESSNPTLRETNSSQLNVNEFGFEENTLINDKPTEKFMEDELDLEKRLRELDDKYVMEEKLLLSLENENKEMEQRFSRRSSISSGTQIISRSASKHSNLSYSEIEVTEVDTKKPENNHSWQRSLPLINKENLELDEVMESEFENNTFLKKSSYFNKSCDSLETIMKDSVANQLKAEELEKREFLEKCQKLHSEEIALESELDRLLKSLESEKKKFEKLTYELEIFNANRGSYIRERKLLKSKIRLLQDKLKTIQQWIKIEGKGIFSREKDRATILLQKAQKILDQKNSKLVEIKKRKDHFMAISNNKRIVAVQVMTKSSELKTILNKIRQENIENCATIEKTETLIVEKKASRERQLLNRAQVEENRRKFEFDLLFQACNHQNPNIPLDFDQLRIFNINSMNLTRLPDLSPVPNLRFINMDHNAFTNLEGLNPVADLNYLTLNSNHINKLDLVSVKNIKHLEAAHNHISNVLGLANCKYLKWLDLSYNPIRSIDFLKEALSLKVLLIRSVMVPNFSSLSNLKNLMALDLGGNHIYNDPLLMIKEMHILQYLALDENSYTEVPDISNAMLFELRLEKNKLRTVNFVSFLPMLRILHLEHNSINNTTPFSMLPNLQELYLQENNLHDISCVYGVAICRNLKILDISKNPVSYNADLEIIIFTLFRQLKYVNGLTFREFFSGNDDFSWTNPLKQLKHLNKCVNYLCPFVGDWESENQRYIENDDYYRIHKTHYKSIKSYLGKYKPPYITFLSMGGEEITEENILMEVQEKNVNWLENTSHQFQIELKNLYARSPPHSDICLLPAITKFKDIAIFLQISYVQACWRRKMAMKAKRKRMRAILCIQKSWRAFQQQKIFKLIKKLRSEKVEKAAITIRRYWKGYKARVLLKKLKHQVFLNQPIPEDENLDNWVSETFETNFELRLDDYLKDDLKITEEERARSSRSPRRSTEPEKHRISKEGDAVTLEESFHSEKKSTETEIEVKITEIEKFVKKENLEKNLPAINESEANKSGIKEQTEEKVKLESEEKVLDVKEEKKKILEKFKSEEEERQRKKKVIEENIKQINANLEKKNDLVHEKIKAPAKKQIVTEIVPEKTELETEIEEDWGFKGELFQETLNKNKKRYANLKNISKKRTLMNDPNERLKVFQKQKDNRKVVYIWDSDTEKEMQVNNFGKDSVSLPIIPPEKLPKQMPLPLTIKSNHNKFWNAQNNMLDSFQSYNPTGSDKYKDYHTDIHNYNKKITDHSQYAPPTGISPKVTLLLNNYVATKLLGNNKAEFEKKGSYYKKSKNSDNEICDIKVRDDDKELYYNDVLKTNNYNI